jgi:hypothetical protein
VPRVRLQRVRLMETSMGMSQQGTLMEGSVRWGCRAERRWVFVH